MQKKNRRWMHSRGMVLTPMVSRRKQCDPIFDPVRKFDQVTQDALDIADDYRENDSIEPSLETLLELAKNHPESRKEFESVLIQLLDNPVEGAVEVVSFLMHDLRWEIITDEIGSRIENPKNVSHVRLYKAMLESFSDSWRDRDLYTRYS